MHKYRKRVLLLVYHRIAHHLMQTRTGSGNMVRVLVQFLVAAVEVECLVRAEECLVRAVEFREVVHRTVQIVEMAHKQPGLPAHGRKSN